jgi:hypothetical protein
MDTRNVSIYKKNSWRDKDKDAEYIGYIECALGSGPQVGDTVYMDDTELKVTKRIWNSSGLSVIVDANASGVVKA